MKTGLLKRTFSLILSMFVLFSSVGGEVALAANTNTGSAKEETVTNEVTEKEQLDEEFEVEKRLRSAAAIVAGSTYSTATNVELNKTYTSSFTDTGAAFYKFTLTKPGIVDFSFNNNSGKTNYATLYFAYDAVSNTSLYNVNWDSNPNFQKKVGLAAGTYCIYIDYFYNDYYEDLGGNYDFCVNFTPNSSCETEANATLGTADVIAVNTSIYANASYSNKDDEDYFKFTIPQAGCVQIELAHNIINGRESDNMFTVDFYNTASGNEIHDFASVGGETLSKSAKLGLPAGTYYFRVYGNRYADDYTVKVNYTKNAYWEKENNATPSLANELKLNANYSGAICESGDTDYFKFTTTEAGAVSLGVTHALVSGLETSSCYRLCFYSDATCSDEIYSMYIDGAETSVSTPKVGLPKGTYYVKMTSGSYAVPGVPYTLKVNYEKSSQWETESNDTVTLADSIKVNTDYNGTIHDYSDYDYYKFTLSDAGKVQLKFTHPLISGAETSTCYYVYIYNDAALENELCYIASKGSDKSISSPEIGLPKGTYYIKVYDGYETPYTTYGLRVNYTKSSNWEREFNETATTATTIKSGQTYSGAITDGSDEDYYKIKVSNDGYITVNLKHSASGTNGIYNLYVYDSKMNEVAYRNIKASEKDYTTAKIGLKKGTYYILVDNSSVNTGTYKLKVTAKKASDWEKEINDSTSAATKISVGKTVKGATVDSGDNDYYKFTLSSATYVNVSMTHEEMGGTNTVWYVTIYDKNGNRISYSSDSYMYVEAGEVYDETTPVKLAKGTYYVAVDPYSYAEDCEYTLSVNKVKKVTPSITSVKSAGHNKMKVTWKAIPGATKYEIYRSTSKNGSYKKVKTVSDVGTTSWTDTKVSTGKTYYYKMKATVKTNKNLKSGYSKVKSAKVTPTAPTLSSVKSTTKKQAKLTWKKVDGASGYEIYKATSKDGKYKKVTTIKKGSTKTYTEKKLTSKKTYYYKVRAYRTVSGKKVYSGYSAVKSVKVK